MVNYSPEQMDAIFGALADPTRRAILERLAQGEASVSELALPFGTTLPAVMKHLKVLEDAGLITCAKSGRVRTCRLAAAPLEGATVWLERYRRFWETRFDALDAFLRNEREE